MIVNLINRRRFNNLVTELEERGNLNKENLDKVLKYRKYKKEYHRFSS